MMERLKLDFEDPHRIFRVQYAENFATAIGIDDPLKNSLALATCTFSAAKNK